MRPVAGDTRFHRVVGHRVDLRESFGTRLVVGMARRAELPIAWGGRLDVDGVLGVPFSSAVAGFAGHVAVIAGLLQIHLGLVAIHADNGTGVLQFMHLFPLNRGSALELTVRD